MASAATRTTTGTMVATPATVLGVQYVSSVTAGSFVLKNNGAGGTTLLTVNTPAGVGHLFVPIAGGGIAFATDVHATLTNVDSVTIIYH